VNEGDVLGENTRGKADCVVRSVGSAVKIYFVGGMTGPRLILPREASAKEAALDGSVDAHVVVGQTVI